MKQLDFFSILIFFFSFLSLSSQGKPKIEKSDYGAIFRYIQSFKDSSALSDHRGTNCGPVPGVERKKNYASVGTGSYDGTANGIFGRKVINSNQKYFSGLELDYCEGDVIAVKLCINNEGRVTYCEYIESQTNVEIPAFLIKRLLKGFYGYKYESSEGAPKKQCGKLIYSLSD